MTGQGKKMTRSEMMSRIRSKNTVPEIIMQRILRLQGYRIVKHPDLPGHPDILVSGWDCVVFVHGCFWHGCKKHFRLPKTNTDFWRKKIERNIGRHKRNAGVLRSMGYTVLEIWEHDLK